MNLRNLLLGTAVALAPSLAFAADLPSRVAPLPMLAAAPAFSWTGFYGGFNVGYGILNTTVKQDGTGSGTGTNYSITSNGYPTSGSGSGGASGTQHVNAGGFLGGVQFGYNQQFNNIVAGLEADLDLGNITGHSSMAGSGSSTVYTSGSGTSAGGNKESSHVSSQMTAFGTLRGRLGIAVDKTFIFATGGLAFAQLRNTVSLSVQQPGYWGGMVTATPLDGWRTGWTAGVGIEYALTDKISVKAEGLYYDLGKQNYSASNTYSTLGYNGLTTEAGSVSNTGYVARIGLNFHL